MSTNSNINLQQAPIHQRKSLLRRFWTWILLTGIVLLATHSFWLPYTGKYLIYENPIENPAIVIPVAGRTSNEYAVNMLKNRPLLRIHCILSDHNRLHSLGIIPSPEESAKKEFASHGINPDIITFYNPKEDATSIDDYYKRIIAQMNVLFDKDDKPEIELIAPAHLTRRLHWYFNQQLSPEAIKHIHIKAISPNDFDLEKWWTTRHGIRCVTGEYLLLINFMICSNSAPRHILTEEDFKASAVIQTGR